ncbi:MAG: bifunctional diaminohydroxyphosphoribosylaminopyrimidine deaminase/5-amino-6-(5-phosphoribosylamino)uracil reductase RibD [Gemmatimonadales bacterium]|nr:bifunctional diaminohydroxyphosphoribosylaminopyrimidine deaminase/5-amino-6-(5-phosphoribosylamino)uracil reductase RibD [Gemmatimonadales bacterium]
MDEREAMAHALSLAWRGWGRVHPNPLVGAVVLADGLVVGEGWHAEFGGRHAEPGALERAGERARGATLVVTLEPCDHQGKQPPCTEAILRAGVRRVVAGLADPNPAASGGAARLGSLGLQVELGVAREAVATQNARFLHGFRNQSRPFVALKLATSLDGRIADSSGHSRWISGEPARDYVHWLRAGFAAIGVGGRTARLDDPRLTVRGPVTPRVTPRRVIFDAGADIDSRLTLVRTAGEAATTVVTASDAPSDRVERLLSAGVSVVRAGTLEEGLRMLRGEGIDSLLVEGGGRLAGALLGLGLVDRYYWVQSPLWLGDRGVPATAGLPSDPIARAERWAVVERRALGEDTLLVADRR